MATASVSPIVSDRELLMAVAQGKMPLDKALELMTSMKQAIRADAAAQATKVAPAVAPVEFTPADRPGWVICYHSRRPNGCNSLFPSTLPLDVWERIFAAQETFKAFADAQGKDAVILLDQEALLVLIGPHKEYLRSRQVLARITPLGKTLPR